MALVGVWTTELGQRRGSALVGLEHLGAIYQVHSRFQRNLMHKLALAAGAT